MSQAIATSYQHPSATAADTELLREAVDHVSQGVVILDAAMQVRFVNAAARQMWGLTEEQCAGAPDFGEFIYNIATTGVYGLPEDELAGYVLRRFDTVQSGSSIPIDIRTICGKTIRAQVTPLPSGGRMLTHVDVTDLVQEADHLRQLASLDPLTGLANRRDFIARAEAEFTRYRRYNTPFSIAAIDIDLFKRVNDELGHDVGDRAILHVASILEHCKRATDVVARLGGDEFSVLLPNTPASDGLVFVERVRRTVEFFPLHTEAAPVNLTMSAGLAEAREAMLCAEAVLKAADEALYAAKRSGRNACRAA